MKVENVYFSLSLFELRREIINPVRAGRAGHDVKKELWIRLGPLYIVDSGGQSDKF